MQGILGPVVFSASKTNELAESLKVISVVEDFFDAFVGQVCYVLHVEEDEDYSRH